MPTILHVDRSRFFQKIINELAVQKSYTYLSAQTAQEAFALLRENAVDYIISSKELDKSTGEEFIKELNMSPPKDIPVPGHHQLPAEERSHRGSAVPISRSGTG